MRRDLTRPGRRASEQYSLGTTLVAGLALTGGLLGLVVVLSYPVLGAAFAGGLLLERSTFRVRDVARRTGTRLRRPFEGVERPSGREAIPGGE